MMKIINNKCSKCGYDGVSGWNISNPVQCPECGEYEEIPNNMTPKDVIAQAEKEFGKRFVKITNKKFNSHSDFLQHNGKWEYPRLTVYRPEKIKEFIFSTYTKDHPLLANEDREKNLLLKLLIWAGFRV